MLKLSFSKSRLECGTDEAGRGCLAGPVVAASVIISKKLSTTNSSIFERINDSKKITDRARRSLYPLIIKNALA